MRICVYEDSRVATLEPICFTRPAFELRCGFTTLLQKYRRTFGAESYSGIIRPEMVPFYRHGHSPIPLNDYTWLEAEPTLLVNARWLPPTKGLTAEFNQLENQEPFVATIGDEVAFAKVTPKELQGGSVPRFEDHIHHLRRTLPNRPAPGQLIRYLWELVDECGDQIAADFHATRNHENTTGRPANLTLIGPSDWLRVDPTARIDPFVVVDTNKGPVVIDRDVVITSFTRIEGPCYIGPRSQIYGASIRPGTMIGHNCRIGGTVEASILQGFTNKVHDGFLGHSYIGEWVNIGAGTQTSDLRNDYGEVLVTSAGYVTPTGRKKVGALIGDHTKTGLGCLLNTGTNIGIFGQILPSGNLLPKFVPSFCGIEYGKIVDKADIDQLLRTATQVMDRRGEVLSTAHEAYYRLLYDRLGVVRRRQVHECELRRLRRTG